VPIAVLDACVLYPASLRDFLMRLAVRLYQPKWTDNIHEEWIRNVLKDRPDLRREQLLRTRDLMNQHGGSCLVSGYQSLIPSLELPDAGDRHVLAAAIKSGASHIVTFNLRDFPPGILAPFNIQAIHPDDFTMALFDSNPESFLELVAIHRQALVNPAKTSAEYADMLAACGLPRIAARLHDCAAAIQLSSVRNPPR
jgi:hypothetical protein